MSTATAEAPDPGGALARLLRAPTAFYRDRLAALGARAALAAVPLSRRAELLRDQLTNLPHGTRRLAGAPPPVRVGISGSGADLLVLAWSAADLARERAAGVRLLGRLGLRAGMRIGNTLAGALVTPGALLLGDVVEDIGALDVPLGTIDGEAAARQAWELVERVRPDIVVLEAATVARFFAVRPGGEWPWWRGIVWLCRGTVATPPPVPPGFAGWQRTWLAVPEATSFVAGSCGAGRFHLDDAVLAEVVDESTGAPVGAGGGGMLALTVPDGDAPVLRYATNLGACAPPTPCPCGAGGTTVELR